MSTIIDRILLSVAKGLPSEEKAPGYQSRALERCFVTTRLFYAICMLWLVGGLGSLPKMMVVQAMDPLWPIYWVKWAGIGPGALVIYLGAAATAAFATLCPQTRAARILFVLFVLEFAAFSNSFGKINHGWHVPLAIAFFLCFLPNGSADKVRICQEKTHAYLNTIFFAIAAFMLCYSISGFWKIVIAFYQMGIGEIHAFHPEALAYHVSRRLQQTSETPNEFASILLEHPWVGWLPYLSVLYLEFFAIVAAFRVRSHRVFGLGLIGFHLGSGLVLNIPFAQNQMMLIIWMIASPLMPTNTTFKEELQSLPLFGDVWCLLARRLSTV